MDEPGCKELLGRAGIAVPRGVVVRDLGFAAAAGLREPLVLKGIGPLHKSEAGAVRLGLTHDELAPAAAAMPGDLSGFLVEEQAAAGVELIVGLVRDPGFGPVLLAGLGGVLTEVLRDTALRLCPVSEAGARSMLSSLRGSALLDGYRGAPAVDLDAVVTMMLALGGDGGLWERLELGEFEVNPAICTADGVIAVDARYLPPEPAEDAALPAVAPIPAGQREVGDFMPLFHPKAVAVVGASATRPNFGNMFLEFYKSTGVPLVAVHPSATEIDGVPAVRSLADAAVDYALVAVPADRCAEVVRQAAGVPYTQVMSGGFGEAGRPDLEADLLAAARTSGTRLLGPNCMGVYSPRGRQTFVGGGLGEPGTIALISQSGGLAGEVISVGERRGLRFSRVATLGNSLDVTPAELLRWLSGDGETSAIGLYLEDPRDGQALFTALSGCRKPVVLLVGGRSAQGRRAAASHTGGLVSDQRIWQALADQTGAALVTSQDDLIGALSYLQAHGGTTRGGRTAEPGVLVIGPSGGASVLAADVLDRAGLELPPLPGEALDDLRALGLGTGSSLANPLEIPVGPRGRAALVTETVEAIVRRRPYADVVAHVNVQSFFTYGTRPEPLLDYARALTRAAGTARITLVTRNAECAPPGVEDAVRRIAAEAGIPVYRSMEAAAAAVAAGGRHGAA
ncbi:acetate--CoA ligase family protein [Nonomuraea sp. NBC_01738]|uniref:acetate--CoA ligase family protein n=1 Tax=Nonomuraea sp. NBC_01738 TaxID=2976003 RepID=UPI002E1341CD|nr:acetate--CoA ligase family protein [Nonomuraea sp. NBC_01738]